MRPLPHCHAKLRSYALYSIHIRTLSKLTGAHHCRPSSRPPFITQIGPGSRDAPWVSSSTTTPRHYRHHHQRPRHSPGCRTILFPPPTADMACSSSRINTDGCGKTATAAAIVAVQPRVEGHTWPCCRNMAGRAREKARKSELRKRRVRR